MASMKKMVGQERRDPKTGKVRAGKVSYRLRWNFGGTRDGEPQCVTWSHADAYEDMRTLKRKVEERGHRVRKTDPDVLDRSIVTGKPTRQDDTAGKPFGKTVPEVFAEFIAQKVKDGRKQSTITTYEGGNRGGVLLKFWADEYVSQIDEDKARALLEHITDDLGIDYRAPMETATAVLNFAVRKGYLSANPMPLVAKPDQLRFKPRFLEQSEFELLLSFVPESDPEFWLLMVAAWESGLREGELLGLEREDVTKVNGTAYITVSRTTVEPKRGPITTGLPKNKKDRVVVISNALADMLLAPGRHPRRIFPAARNANQYMRKGCVNQKFRKIRELAREGKAGVKLTGRTPRFHDLRHSHASNLLGQGVDMYVVSKRLGHSSIKITVDTYGHLGKKAEDAVLAAIAVHGIPNRHALKAISDAA